MNDKKNASQYVDDHAYIKRTCFVIMPFGQKVEIKSLGSPSSVGHGGQIDFDHIFDNIILPAVRTAGRNLGIDIDCVRSDRISRAGFIPKEIIEHVTSADLAIVDITTQNANVFYELGVRHSFRRSTTILIRKAGTYIPFNITGMRVFEYNDEGAVAGIDGLPLSESTRQLTQAIERSLNEKENDSLVHNLVPGLTIQRSAYPIMEQRWIAPYIFDPARVKTSKRIGYITGDLMNIREVDAWVNPENTMMQMARFHEGSVSSCIRYFGAERDRGGHVIYDTIALALKRAAGRTRYGVEAGTVVATKSGKLRQTNNVKVILHVAGLQGEPGYGYQPVRDYAGCIRRVLHTIERINLSVKRRAFCRHRTIKSVLIPLFGVRSISQHPQDVSDNMFRSAAIFLSENPDVTLDEVYFLAYTDRDRQVCESALGLLGKLGIIEPSQSQNYSMQENDVTNNDGLSRVATPDQYVPPAV